MPPRLAVAGFQHETNTFVATPTTRADFERGGSWPPLVRGAALVDALAPTAPPIGGALEAARAADVESVPVVWGMAQPSGRVTADAFATIAGEIV
ncbi:MAG: microcystin degradation protein MlrC, partial [Alphaproteobacteria bacterium]|nr:microcystin degradation protein MlrC [Alphaproteobacteria bacterium]